MSFFENIGKKVGEAAQAAAKKSGELVETTKINMNIGSEEEKVEKLFIQIGKKVFENFGKNLAGTEEFADICTQIKEHQENVANFRKKIMELKHLKNCEGCGKEIDQSVLFCDKCGAKQEVVSPVAGEVKTDTKACPKCNAELKSDASFCGSCGNKID